jgi:hypothetical protein
VRHLVGAYRPDAAKVAFQHAIDLDPKYSPARFGLGTALLSSGHPPEATEVTQKTLAETACACQKLRPD